MTDVTPEPGTPTTEAGRNLLADRPSMNPIELRRRILAIEAEAVASLTAQLAERDAEIARLRGVMVYLCQEGCTMSGNCSEEFGDDEDSWCEVCVMRAALSPTTTESEAEA